MNRVTFCLLSEANGCGEVMGHMNQPTHLLLGGWLTARTGFTWVYQGYLKGFSIIPSGLASVVLSIFTTEVWLNSLDYVRLLKHCVSLGKTCPFQYRSLTGNWGS